jgi:hypothetical protein
VTSRAASLTVLANWLAETHPNVTSLRSLTRAHLEAFCTFNASRRCRGRMAGQNRPISITHHARTITDLRCFFDDLTAWGWAERPPGCCCTAATSPGCPQHCPARCHPTSTPR